MTDPRDVRIETLEVKLAHLEHSLQALNDVVVRQQRDIDGLRLRSQQLAQQLEATEGGAADATAIEVPPHY